jgi:pyruvate dehydrogenase E2 component (dihydrolipoamide acetyltransferase)
MVTAIIMPQLGQDIDKAKIVEWVVKENSPVKKGDIVVVVESDKATFEMEAEASGVLLKILHDKDEEVEILTPIGYIGEKGETIEEPGKTDMQKKKKQPEKVQPGAERQDAKLGAGRVPASPAVRRLARERGIDIEKIKGTGPEGRITRENILSALSSDKIPPDESGDIVEQFSDTRKVIAIRLTESKQNIPHFYLFTEVDMTGTLKWRTEYNRENNIKITVTDIIVKATALALLEYKRMNAHVAKDKVVLKKNVNVGIAVPTGDGVLVPVIEDADSKSISEINRISKENSENARRRVLNLKSKSTFTVSNLGMYSINYFMPIINPPECSILAVGKSEKKVVPVDDNTTVRDMMTLGIACDHRAVDGAYAAQFLNKIKQLLENFESLLFKEETH